MPQANIQCPICQKKGKLDVPEELLKNAERGLLAINISEDIICEHSFMAYVDKNLAVRDYFVADFKVEIPQLSTIEKVQHTTIPEKDIKEMDLIKLYLHAISIAYLMKSILIKQKIVLIFEQKFLYNHIFNFVNYITQDSFEVNLLIMTMEEYNANKKKYKDAFVINSTNVIRNPKKINLKKLNVEKQIIKDFLSRIDLNYAYIVLKNEFQKAYELSKSMVSLIEEERKTKKTFNILEIKLNVEKEYNIKINKLYLNFLIEIIEKYFDIKVPSITDGLFDYIKD